MSLRDIACDVGECKRNTSQTHTMVKFENTFSTKLKKIHKNKKTLIELFFYVFIVWLRRALRGSLMFFQLARRAQIQIVELSLY